MPTNGRLKRILWEKYLTQKLSIYVFWGIVIWAGFMWSQINALTFLAGKITYHL